MTVRTQPVDERRNSRKYPHVLRWADFSEDLAYRYLLGRRWNDGPGIWWVMHNPSVANANTDDATVRRIMQFSDDFGAGACYVVNLFAYVATDPDVLRSVDDPVGPENDWYLRGAAAAGRPDVMMCAWGARATPTRVAQVLDGPLAAARDGGRLHCLGVTRNGAPKHPLYVRASARPTPWKAP